MNEKPTSFRELLQQKDPKAEDWLESLKAHAELGWPFAMRSLDELVSRTKPSQEQLELAAQYMKEGSVKHKDTLKRVPEGYEKVRVYFENRIARMDSGAKKVPLGWGLLEIEDGLLRASVEGLNISWSSENNAYEEIAFDYDTGKVIFKVMVGEVSEENIPEGPEVLKKYYRYLDRNPTNLEKYFEHFRDVYPDLDGLIETYENGEVVNFIREKKLALYETHELILVAWANNNRVLAVCTDKLDHFEQNYYLGIYHPEEARFEPIKRPIKSGETVYLVPAMPCRVFGHKLEIKDAKVIPLANYLHASQQQDPDALKEFIEDKISRKNKLILSYSGDNEEHVFESLNNYFAEKGTFQSRDEEEFFVHENYTLREEQDGEEVERHVLLGQTLDAKGGVFVYSDADLDLEEIRRAVPEITMYKEPSEEQGE